MLREMLASAACGRGSNVEGNKQIKSHLMFLGNLSVWLSRIPFISGSNILNLQKVLNTRIVEKGRKCLNSIYLNFIA